MISSSFGLLSRLLTSVSGQAARRITSAVTFSRRFHFPPPASFRQSHDHHKLLKLHLNPWLPEFLLFSFLVLPFWLFRPAVLAELYPGVYCNTLRDSISHPATTSIARGTVQLLYYRAVSHVQLSPRPPWRMKTLSLLPAMTTQIIPNPPHHLRPPRRSALVVPPSSMPMAIPSLSSAGPPRPALPAAPAKSDAM
jgi:hypothetical protein